MKLRDVEKMSSLKNPIGEICCDSKVKTELLNDQ